MPVLRSLESKIAGLVEGTFSRLFRSEVRPVELARKLAREMEEHKSFSVSRTYVPNEYRVFLSPRDREHFAGYEGALADELSAYLLEHARRENLVMLSRPMIEFETDERLGLGEFGILTRAVTPAPDPDEAQHEYDDEEPERDGQTVVYGDAVDPHPGLTAASRHHAVLLVEGRRMLVGPTGVTLGRSRDCDVVVDDANVSRRHAEVRLDDGGWLLRDLASTNGSVLNGRRIEGPERLHDGDEIELGTSLITFELE